jgi:hypothetical protein
MADIKHVAPVEGDGVDYRGIVWFLVILVGTVVFCQVLVWGLFVWTESRVVASDAVRSPLAAEQSQPAIERGRLTTGAGGSEAPAAAPRPGLLIDEPTVLAGVRTAENEELSTYGWENQGAGIVRLPISRAKEIALERGFAVRQTAPAAETAVGQPAAAPR